MKPTYTIFFVAAALAGKALAAPIDASSEIHDGENSFSGQLGNDFPAFPADPVADESLVTSAPTPAATGAPEAIPTATFQARGILDALESMNLDRHKHKETPAPDSAPIPTATASVAARAPQDPWNWVPESVKQLRKAQRSSAGVPESTGAPRGYDN